MIRAHASRPPDVPPCGTAVRRRRRIGRSAFSLIELLVVIAMIALIVALLLPSLSGARHEGLRVKCVSNLKSIGDLAKIFSAEEHARRDNTAANVQIPGIASGILHPQAASGEVAWRGLGAWDWGGADGTDRNMNGAGTTEFPSLGAETRPLNRMATTGSVTRGADFSVFRCPSDEGQVASPVYGGDTPDSRRSLFLAKGNSYQGDFIWLRQATGSGGAGVGGSPGLGPQTDVAYRFGTFMRPVNMIPAPSETTLFYEGRFAQAFIHTSEFVAGGAFGGGPVMDVPGWHGRVGEFNVLFADAHVEKIKLRKTGGMYRFESFDPTEYPYRTVMARGPGWRTDCFPAKLVEERKVGNP